MMTITKSECNTIEDIKKLSKLFILNRRTDFISYKLLTMNFPYEINKYMNIKEERKNIIKMSILLKGYLIIYNAGKGTNCRFKINKKIFNAHNERTSNVHRWKIKGIKELLNSI